MKLLPTITFLGALAAPAAAEAQTNNAFTLLGRSTLAPNNPPQGVHGGFIEAYGFQVTYDHRISGPWAFQLENNTMFGSAGTPLTLAVSDYATVPGYRRSTDGAVNTGGATRSRQTNLSVQGLFNLTCLWPLNDHWKAGLMFALGANYAETTDTFVRHDVGSPARPGSTVRVGAYDQTSSVSSFRSEIQFRAGVQVGYISGPFSLRLESFYHINPRIDGTGPDEGASLTTRLAINFAPSIGDFQFPFNVRTALALQRGADHVYYFNPSFEFRAGVKWSF